MHSGEDVLTLTPRSPAFRGGQIDLAGKLASVARRRVIFRVYVALSRQTLNEFMISSYQIDLGDL